MALKPHVVHILDDLAMGGVTRALDNFNHPTLQALGTHEAVDIRRGRPRAPTRNSIAVVHFTASWRKLPWLMDLRLRGQFSRLLLVEHSYTAGFEASEVRATGRFRQMLKTAYGQVDAVIAVSETQRRWIIDSGLARAGKVTAIPQSRDCGALSAMTPPRRAGGPLRLGAFGRFHRQKGFDLLINAMARIPPHLATLRLAGAGPEAGALNALAAPLETVELCPPFVSPEAFLETTDVVAVPSRWEAFGLVGTEARSAARPLLVAEVDGLIDQIGRTAFSHTCNSVSGLANAIHNAAMAHDIATRGLLARAEVAGEFDRMIQRWSDILAPEVMLARAA